MNAGNEVYTDKTWIYDEGRAEMDDSTHEFHPGLQDNELLNFMLGTICSNPCGDPENAGFSKYDFETHCTAFRIIAKCETVNILAMPNPTFNYDIKAVYTISV